MNLRLHFILAMAAMMFANSVCAKEFCDYTNTNELARDKNLPILVHRFLGDKRVNFFYTGGLYEQVLEGLGGPPDQIHSLTENLKMATACRYHSCDEKAAVIFACPGVIQAVGILHFDIRPGHFDPKSATLTIYAKELPSAVDMAFNVWRESIEKTTNIKIVKDVQTFWK